MKCDHYQTHYNPELFYCNSGSFLQHEIHAGFCDECPFHTNRTLEERAEIQGVGDVIEIATKAVGIKKKRKCGCGHRKAKLNRILPFSSSRLDKRWTTVVTTAPRTTPTIDTCVGSLRESGWEPIIFAEPDSCRVDDAETYTNKERLGIWRNWVKAARWALGTKAQWIMTVQDDAAFHPDSKSFAESILWPSENTGFVSLYTPSHYTKNKKLDNPPGINRIRTRALWGACALIWDPAVLREALDSELAQRWLGASPRSRKKSVWEKRRQNPHMIQNSDTAIGHIMNRMEREMYFVDPSPVRHISEESTVGHGGNRGRRNCGRCADWTIPLGEQVPTEGLVVHGISA